MIRKKRALHLLLISIASFLLITGSGTVVMADSSTDLNCNRNFFERYETHRQRVILLSSLAEKKNIEAKEEFVDLLDYLDRAVKSGGVGVLSVINQGKITVKFLWDFNDFLWETMEFWGEAIAIIDPYSELYQNYDDLNIPTPNSPLNAPRLITSLFHKTERSLEQAIEVDTSSQQKKLDCLEGVKKTISTVLDAVEEQGSFRQRPADLQMVFRHMESLAGDGGQSRVSLEDVNPFGSSSSGGSSGGSRKERLRTLRAYMRDFAALLKEITSDMDSHIDCLRKQ